MPILLCADQAQRNGENCSACFARYSSTPSAARGNLNYMRDHLGPLNAAKEECCKTDDLHSCVTRWKVSRRTKPRHSTGVPNRSDSNILAGIRESVRRLILPHRSGPGVGRRISDEIVHTLLGRSYHISVLH